MNLQSLLISITLTLCLVQNAPARRHDLPLAIPRNLKGIFSGTDYLEKCKFKIPNRKLTPKEHLQLKKLLLWADDYDLKHNGITYSFSRKCPMWDLLAREFPGVEYVSLESTFTDDMAYVVRHSLTPKQVTNWRNAHADNMLRKEKLKYASIPGYRFPAKITDNEFDVYKYLELYQVDNPQKKLDIPEKKKLIRFLQEAVEIDDKKNLIDVSISSYCPIMKLIRANFPKTNKMHDINDIQTPVSIRELLKILKDTD